MPRSWRNPLIYEINTRCWLRELSAAAGTPVRLAGIPDEEPRRLRRLGFTDAGQLDYRNPEPRGRMQNELLSVANRCDGVRCDMAMLLLEEVFARSWAGVPAPVAAMDKEFWVTAIGAIRSAHPDFVFVAE